MPRRQAGCRGGRRSSQGREELAAATALFRGGAPGAVAPKVQGANTAG